MKTDINWLRNLESYQKYSEKRLEEKWNMRKNSSRWKKTVRKDKDGIFKLKK